MDVTGRTRQSANIGATVSFEVPDSRRSARVFVWMPDRRIPSTDREQIRTSRCIALLGLKIIDALHGTEFAQQELRFSQKAGCSCGCSPGFIVEGIACDIFVTLTEKTEVRRGRELETVYSG